MAESAGSVITVNAVEVSSTDVAGVFKVEGIMFSSRALTDSHQRSSFLTWKDLNEPSGHQLNEIILVEQGHVGLTVNPIILKDIYRMMQTLLLEH